MRNPHHSMHGSNELTAQFVGELLDAAGEEMIGAAVKVKLLQGVSPVCIIPSTDQNDIGLKPYGSWLNDLVKGNASCCISRANCIITNRKSHAMLMRLPERKAWQSLCE